MLPSGKTIEVVYFDGQRDQAAAEPQRVEDLHVCQGCCSGLVHPIQWEEAGPTHWEVVLRCPNCEWTTSGVFHQELVERLDEELDHGTEILVRDLKRLMHANMEEEVDRFVSALAADQILPMDF